MGLDTSHNAFHGSYSSFNRLRQYVAMAMGGSFPPHWKRNASGSIIQGPDGYAMFDETRNRSLWYWGEGYSPETHPGLHEFLSHSDCDGEISPEMCVKVADDLEALLPKLAKIDLFEGDDPEGWYGTQVKQFIAGCRAAAAAGECLEFH